VFAGEPLLVGMDLTIASFDAISEVNMVGLHLAPLNASKCDNTPPHRFASNDLI
jgi:hypothetical protein